MPVPETSDYRLAPALVARFVGGWLALLGVLMLVGTAAVTVAELPLHHLLIPFAVGLIVVAGAARLLRGRCWVVRLDAVGYRVRLVRGAGVRAATWREVDSLATASPRRVRVVVLRLRDGGTTTIPVGALAADRELFVRDLRQRLQQAHGL